MPPDIIDTADSANHNTQIKNVLWACLLLAVAAEFVLLLIQKLTDKADLMAYAIEYVFTPAGIMLIAGVAMEIAFYLLGKYKRYGAQRYLLIIFTCFIATIVSIFHSNIYLDMVLYVFPMLVPITFAIKRLTVFTYIACIVSLTVIETILLFQGKLEPLDLHIMRIVGAYIVLTGVFLICLYGVKLINDLIEYTVNMAREKLLLSSRLKLDSFTGLMNYAAFYEELDEHIIEFKSSGRVFSIFIIDIDSFKRVNDTFGHAMGDLVIMALVQIIQNEKLDSDLSFRYGGEEFVVITHTPDTEAFETAERIRTTFSEARIPEMPGEQFAVSIGICQYKPNFGRREYFAAADAALYYAKRSGKNRTVIYDDQNHMDVLTAPTSQTSGNGESR